jgi:hypothetical protein
MLILEKQAVGTGVCIFECGIGLEEGLDGFLNLKGCILIAHSPYSSTDDSEMCAERKKTSATFTLHCTAIARSLTRCLAGDNLGLYIGRFNYLDTYL